jgi:hypothetical protein
MDKLLTRGQYVFITKPQSKFAKVEKVVSDSRVLVSYYTNEQYTEREEIEVSINSIRTLDNVGYKEETEDVPKKKRVIYARKQKSEFNKKDVDDVLNDLGI